MTRIGPHRSAIMAAKGAATPTIRLWVAMAIEIGPRPQSMSMLMGCMNSPNDWRTPDVTNKMQVAPKST